MSLSAVQIVNMALLDIGANLIASLAESSANAIKANLVYEPMRDEVLEAKEWKFCTTRATLSAYSTDPSYGFQHAYSLPTDFLRLSKPIKSGSKGMNPLAYASGYWYQLVDSTGYSRYFNYDPPVYPPGFPYKIEMVDAADHSTAKCLVTDYDNTNYDIKIRYVRKVTDTSLFTPAFTTALSARIAAKLAIVITENPKKAEQMMEFYQFTLRSAAAVNESYDYLQDEAGSVDWENAGR